MKDEYKALLAEYVRLLDLSGTKTDIVRFSIPLFCEYQDDDWQAVKITDAQNFQTWLMTLQDDKGNPRYCKASVLNIISAVTGFFDYLRKKGIIYANPFAEIKKVKRSKALPRNILTEDKMHSFLDHLRCFWKGDNLSRKRQLYKAHVVAELMYSTGMRINEVIALMVTDVDLVRGVIRVTDSKTNTEREAILNEYTITVLRLYIDEMRDYILFGKNNADMSRLFGSGRSLRSWFNTILQRESEQLELGSFSSHNFRHAVGYHLLRGGCDIRYIQDILGHKRLSSTQVYTKVDKEDLRNVIDTYHPRLFQNVS